MPPTFTHSDFVQRALAAFPDLADDFASVQGMPTLYASVFAHRLQQAKGLADWDAYERGIRLVEQLLNGADDELTRALRWTFMNGLDFDGPRGPVAWQFLSPELQRAWKATRDEVAALSALPRKGEKARGQRP